MLGTGNAPPVPDSVSKKAKDFLKLCFLINPESRPTALELLTDDFTDVGENFIDFPSWVKQAILLKSEQKNEIDTESPESSSSDSSYDDEEDDNIDRLSDENIVDSSPKPLTIS